MRPLLIQHHIPKTAGTSIRQVTRANYTPSEVVGIDWWTSPFREAVANEAARVRRPDGSIRWESVTLGRRKMLETARDYYEALPDRSRVRCFMGHLAGFMLPVVNDRPVRAACMLRDPVDRVISLVRFAEWSTVQRGDVQGESSAVLAAMRERNWTLKDVYRELGGAGALPTELSLPFGRLFNGQARHLLASTEVEELPFSAADDALGAFRTHVFDLLERSYVVGTQDRFPQSLRLFAEAFGWNHVFLPKARQGPRRDRSEGIDEETRALIRAHNSLDSELHAHFSERLRGSPSVTASARARGSVRFRVERARRGLRRKRGRLARRLAAPSRPA